MVVVGEAHRLRSAYKPGNKTARIPRDALLSAPFEARFVMVV